MVWRDAVRDSDLPSTAKLVALVLSTYANGRGDAFPGRATLAGSASLSDRAVDAAIQRLELAGYLAIDPPRRPIRDAKGGVVMRRPGGKSASNRYTLTLPDTANDVRSSKGRKCEPHDLNSEPHALNSERRSHESVEDAESGRVGGASRAPAALAEDDCGGCGNRRPLVDGIYCAACIEVRV